MRMAGPRGLCGRLSGFRPFPQAAPEATFSRRLEAEIRVGLKQFTPVFPAHRRSPALTTMVRISPSEHAIVMGDATYQGVDFLSPRGELLTSVALGNIPTAMVETGRGFYFGCIGYFFPRDEQRGQVLLYERKDRRLLKRVLAEKLPRVSDVQVADLNGDGRDDFVLCAYGNFLGQLSWFEGLEGGDFKEHLLLDKPGALRAVVRDWDGDGKPDLLVTNGDNADFTLSPMRGHHGLRIYRNMEGLKFEERWFFPLNGAYQFSASTFREFIVGRWLTLEAGDVDGDGADDLVLGSLIQMPTVVPDFLKKQWEERGPSVVVLRNRGKKPLPAPALTP